MSTFYFSFFSFIFDNIYRKIVDNTFLLCNNDIKLNRGFFSNVENITPAQVKTWIHKFMLALELQEYATVCENSLPNRAFTSAEIKAPITLNFTADGHYAYKNNINDLADSDMPIGRLLKEMKGLVITIDYLDYEIGYGFIDVGKAFINVENTTTIVFDVVNYDLTKENFIDLAVGDEDDWQELGFED